MDVMGAGGRGRLCQRASLDARGPLACQEASISDATHQCRVREAFTVVRMANKSEAGGVILRADARAMPLHCAWRPLWISAGEGVARVRLLATGGPRSRPNFSDVSDGWSCPPEAQFEPVVLAPVARE